MASRQLVLNKSSEFPAHLRAVVGRQDSDEYISGLHTDELDKIIDGLDEALGGLDPTSVAFKQIFRKLQRICTSSMRLPSSYILSIEKLNTNKNPLASGGFSDVFKGTYDGLVVCVKRLRIASTSSLENIRKMVYREALMWKWLKHPNIVPFRGVTLEPLQILSEWMSNGDLTVYIKQNPDASRVTLLFDVAKGLDYLHNCDVVHGDLKGPNIMVDASGRACITDFGFTRNQGVAGEINATSGGTARWTAPEILGERGSWNKEADVFSFAMVMVEVFTGAAPFDRLASITAALAVMRGERPPRPDHPELTDALWRLMQRCWEQEPHLRPGMPQALRVFNSPPRMHSPSSDPTPTPAPYPTSLRGGIFRSSKNFSGSEGPLKQLRSLDKSSSKFRDQISNILYGEEYQQWASTVQGEDLTGLIDYLDKALDHLDPASPAFRKCLRELRHICGTRTILPPSHTISSQDLTVGRQPVTSGGSSDVYEGTLNGSKVVIKRVRIYSKDGPEEATKTLYREAVVWKRLKHPNIVPLLGITPTPLQIISAWMPGGNLTEYIQKHPGANRLSLLAQAACGLEHLHLQGIVHSDISPGNILITKEGNACLGNFGITEIVTNIIAVDSDSWGTSRPTVVRYMAPELLNPSQFDLRNDKPSKESDVYSLAMTAFEILSGVLPYGSGRESNIAFQIVSGIRPLRPNNTTAGLWLPDPIWNEIQRCWGQNPQSRPHIGLLHQAFVETETKREKDALVTGNGKAKIHTSSPAVSPPKLAESYPVGPPKQTRNRELLIRSSAERANPPPPRPRQGFIKRVLCCR